MSGMPLGKTRIGQIENPMDGSQVLARIRFYVAPTDPAGAIHWFSADGIGCVPFWLVVSSSAHMYNIKNVYTFK
jgi:hypothetical protein